MTKLSTYFFYYLKLTEVINADTPIEIYYGGSGSGHMPGYLDLQINSGLDHCHVQGVGTA